MQSTNIDLEHTRTTLFDPEYEGTTFLKYSQAPHNDVLVNDGLHIRWLSHNTL